MATPHARFRLEKPYKDALAALTAYFAATGRIRHASDANAVRVLIEDAARLLGIDVKVELAREQKAKQEGGEGG